MEDKMIINGETWIRESSIQKKCRAKSPEEVSSVEEVLEQLGTNVQEFAQANAHLTERQLNQLLIETTIKYLNAGWTPNWSDRNQPKYYPWFKYDNGTFVFSGVDGDDCRTAVGSSLIYKTEALCKLGVKILSTQYNNMLK